MGQGTAMDRMQRLTWTPGAGPSKALVDQVLNLRRPTRTARETRLAQTLFPAALGVMTGLGAGLILKAEMGAGSVGLALMTQPAALYAAMTGLAAVATAVSGGLPRLREFSFLNVVTIAAVMMS